MGKVVFNVVLPTKTKMFCGCPVPLIEDEHVYECEKEHVNVQEAAQNSLMHNIITCPVCRGEKGAYPILNKKAVEEAVALVLALNGKINQYTLFDRVKGEDGLYNMISQYSYPIGKEGYVEWNAKKTDDKDEKTEVRKGNGEEYSEMDDVIDSETLKIHIDISSMRLKEAEEEKGIPVLEITSGDINEEQNPYYIEEIEKILFALGMEEWEIVETDDLIETMEAQKTLSYLPDPDIPPVIISQWWTNQIAAKYPDLIHMEEPEVEDEDDF